MLSNDSKFPSNKTDSQSSFSFSLESLRLREFIPESTASKSSLDLTKSPFIEDGFGHSIGTSLKNNELEKGKEQMR